MDTKVDCTRAPGITIRKVVGDCKTKGERVVRTLSGMVGSAVYGVHNPSLLNLARAVVERVLFTRQEDGTLQPPLKPETNVFSLLSPVRAAVLRCTRTTSVVDIEDYPSLYDDARKRAVYERAVASLKERGLTKRDARVKTFVKAEKVNFSAKPDPAPRAIQPCDARYTAMLGRYLKPFEKAMFDGFTKCFGYKVICKGMNACEVATQLRENWDEFVKPVAVGLDATRFDQHVSREALEFEHSFYNAIFKSSELKELLTWQLDTIGVCFTEGYKLTYKRSGGRASGAINTGMGNCIIMCCIVLGYLYTNNVKARLANNGDDCVIVLEAKHLRLLGGISEWFVRFGFKLTIEQPVYVFEQIEFCQTQPVLTADGYRMVRNPFKATSKDMVSLLSWDGVEAFDLWRGAISSCGKSLTAGVPFWYAYYSKLGGRKVDPSKYKTIIANKYHQCKGIKAQTLVTPEARYSFWLAFGMLPDEQIALEELEIDIRYSKPAPYDANLIDSYHTILTAKEHGEIKTIRLQA